VKSGMSFQERARLGMEQISKQEPVTLEEIRAQVLWVKNREFFISKFSNIGSFDYAKENAIEFLKNINGEKYKQLYSEFLK
jgi:hypothetical protein